MENRVARIEAAENDLRRLEFSHSTSEQERIVAGLYRFDAEIGFSDEQREVFNVLFKEVHEKLDAVFYLRQERGGLIKPPFPLNDGEV